MRRTAPTVAADRRAAIATRRPSGPASAGTALFVDDERYVLDSISVAVRGRGFRILTAVGAADALRLLEREHVDVVISDEKMPRMCGTDFLAEVRRRHPEIVRMVLSGSTDPMIIARAVNHAGVFRYLLKPCTPEDMALAVEQALEARAARGSRTATSSQIVSVDDAIANLCMAMQPIYASRCGELYAHEALLRHAGPTPINVVELLDAAAAAGRLWELERAIRRTIASLMGERPAGSAVFVNVHPQSLLDPQLFSDRDPLAAHAAAVVLEITERGSLEEVPELTHRIEALRALGYRVAIDDMGSGYSGLTTFTSILPDFVKFDRELIRSMHKTPSKEKLVRSLTAVCRELKVMTIAEGIEDREDLRAARGMGCTMLQGYLLARPGAQFRHESCALQEM